MVKWKLAWVCSSGTSNLHTEREREITIFSIGEYASGFFNTYSSLRNVDYLIVRHEKSSEKCLICISIKVEKFDVFSDFYFDWKRKTREEQLGLLRGPWQFEIVELSGRVENPINNREFLFVSIFFFWSLWRMRASVGSCVWTHTRYLGEHRQGGGYNQSAGGYY